MLARSASRHLFDTLGKQLVRVLPLVAPLPSTHFATTSSIVRTRSPPSSIANMTVDYARSAKPFTSSRTVLVVGASYGGHRAAQHLVTLLPSSWRVVVLDRNTHFNHLYAFPRVSVVPGHEDKVFVPYIKIFEPQAPLGAAPSTGNRLLHGTLLSLQHVDQVSSLSSSEAFGRGVAHYAPLDAASGSEGEGASSVAFDYLVYALGSHLPPPINVWSVPAKKAQGLGESNDHSNDSGHHTTVSAKSLSNGDTLIETFNRSANITSAQQYLPGSKQSGTAWLRDAQHRIAQAKSVVVIGGGALGVQFASDIAYVYGTPSTPPQRRADGTSVGQASSPKRVTLLSSSARLLPRFQPWMHEHACAELDKLGVEVLTGARADLSTLHDSSDGHRRTLRTLDGRTVEADVVLFCTGQRPNTELLRGLEGGAGSTETVLNEAANNAAFVTPTLQLAHADRTVDDRLQHVFVVGDAADTFGALNAGHTAFAQADVAARNVARLVTQQERKAAATVAAHDDSDDGDSGHADAAPGSADAANAAADEWLGHPLEAYEVEAHKIKVSVGLDRAIIENTGNHRIAEGGAEDLNAVGMWTRRGLDASDLTV